MKILKGCVYFMLLASVSAMADWSGEAKTRFREFTYDDSLNSVDANGNDLSVQKKRTYDFRAAIKYSKKLNNNLTSEVGMRTTSSATSYYANAASAADRAFGLELANVRWSGDSAEATLGRQKIVFDYDTSMQSLWDNDLRMDGLAGKCTKGNWGVAAASYVLGAVNQGTFGNSSYTYTKGSQATGSTTSGMSYVFGLQPQWKWSSDKVKLNFALGRYHWIRAVGFTNRMHGGYNSNSLNSNANTGTVNIHNPRQWQALVTAEYPALKLKGTFELIRNKKMFYGNGDAMDRDAWAGSVKYRDAKKAGEYAVSYGYASKGIASAPGALAYSDFLPDNKGHVVEAAYAPADQMQISLTGYFLKEKSRRQASGISVTNTQEQTTQAFFLAGGVKF